ncbi:sulfonate ABC transporter substrate-binding protein [Acidovorax sp. BL-A-41-H1]|uniref:sulfonate ABC transporter substrate-binding protein n=1 Tax=Acidovorax sp. BL-A-41-H1 TaxID=3421102 RepID=UPI003F7B1975
MTHSHLSPERRRALQLLGVTAFNWALSSRYAHAQSPAVPGPEQLRIGYQKSAVNLVILKQQGVLEKRFPGTRVSWLEFPAGPQLLEALSVGSLEFGLTGDSPPVFAQAAGKDLLYVGAEPPKPDSSALLVLKDSQLRTLADIKGRRIAVQKGSSAHYLLVRAVERAGLQWADIQPVYLTPADARAAFERKSVDAWAIWDPFYAATELAIQPRVLATGRDLASSNNSFYLAARPFVQAHPQVLRVLFEELSRADRLAQDARTDAIKLIADFSGLDAGVVSLFIQRRPSSPVGLLNAETVADQQRVADAFFKLGLIPKPVRVSDIVWRPASAQLTGAAALS